MALVLQLEYKGHSLQLRLSSGYYAKALFRFKGKARPITLYQRLFEALVDGEAVSVIQFARECQRINPSANDGAVDNVMRRIRGAIAKSGGPKLNALSFNRMPAGGSHGSAAMPIRAISPEQRRILLEAKRQVFLQGDRSPQALAKACNRALALAGCDEGVILTSKTVALVLGRVNAAQKRSAKPRVPRRRL
ncbi:MAG: hypothetical protein NTW59_04410 [Candidatus Diapherotrites archaeon]|nr:hypothetical protein [Candidatus Diapherotrites archaeon]